MKQRYSRFPSLSYSSNRIPALSGFLTHMRRLPPGDKFIATILLIIVGIACFFGLVALERTFLVRVPAHGGSLTEGIVGSPRFVNPLLALSDADRDLAALTYAGLMGIGPDGTLIPVLAESYEVSEDGKTYTFIIRENAKFSDGSAVTADDVVFTVDKAQDPGLKSPEYANWANVRAEAVDARTVRFTLPQAYAPFLEDTRLGILPARLWRAVANDQFPFSPLMEHPVGAGPFKVEQVSHDKNGAIKEFGLHSFDGYVLGRPYLEHIRLKFYGNSNDLAQAVRRGSVESAYGVSNEHAITAPYARVFGVFFNPVAEPALADASVREALSVAIDRDRIVREVLAGYGTPLMGPLPPGNGIDSPALPDPGVRLEEARAVLAKAGWTHDEAGGWKKGSTPMPTITLRTSSVPRWS